MNPAKQLLALIILCTLCSCGGGSTSGSASNAAASVEAAASDIAGVWWATDGAPAYALEIEQVGSALKLGDEYAQIDGKRITMTSIGGHGSLSENENQLQLTWEFPGYGTVVTNYQRVDDVLAGAIAAAVPSVQNVDLNNLCVRSFTLSDDEFVSIETNGPENGDTWMFLFNADGELVAEADDPGTNFYAFVEQELAAGTYYVVVTSWTDDLNADLSITVGAGV